MKNKKSLRILGFAVLIAALILLPHILPNTYFIRVIDMVGIFIILATGSNILTGYTGQLSMGQAAFYGLGAYCSGLLHLYLGMGFWAALPVTMGVRALFDSYKSKALTGARVERRTQRLRELNAFIRNEKAPAGAESPVNDAVSVAGSVS